ncbi:MAG TPA: AMP-binding protein, partial [Limnochordales bacterium]
MAELPEWLAYRAAQMGDRVAVLFEDGAWTFRELDRRAAAVASRLSRLGVRPGDRVALLAANGPAFVELVFGVARLGAVLVPLNVRLSAPELAWQLADARPQLLVFDAETKELARQALAVLAEQGVVQQAVAAGELGGPAPGVQAPPPGGEVVELERPFTLMYTSGTTGHPKGVLLTFANHWWSAVASGLNLGVHADDRWLACLPLFHVGGLAILLRSVIYGTTAVVHRRFDEEAVLRALREQDITLLSLVGTMLVRLLQALPQSGRLDSRLRAVLVGGGPVGVQTLERALRAG